MWFETLLIFMLFINTWGNSTTLPKIKTKKLEMYVPQAIIAGTIIHESWVYR